MYFTARPQVLEPLALEEYVEPPDEWHQDNDAVRDNANAIPSQDNANSGATPLNKPRWRDHFPLPAGQRIKQEATTFELLRNAQVERGDSIWGSFKDKGDWDLACWIVESGTTKTSADQLLDLEKVSQKNVKHTTY